MGEQQSRSKAPRTDAGGGADAGLRILSYLLAGLLLYGGLGWLGDQFFDTVWMMPTGLILGVVLSIYLVIKRFGSVE